MHNVVNEVMQSFFGDFLISVCVYKQSQPKDIIGNVKMRIFDQIHCENVLCSSGEIEISKLF